MSKKINEKVMLVMSCIASYLLLSLLSLLRIKYFKKVPDLPLINSALCFFIGSVIVIIISVIFQREWFKKITIRLFHKTLNDDIWRDVLDLRNGSNLKVYLKDKDYYLIGHHKIHEEKENDPWLALSSFAKYDVNTNTNYKNEPSFLNNKNTYIVIRFSDIDHIEVF